MPKSFTLLAAIAPFAIVSLLFWSALDSLRLLNSSFEYVGPRNQLPEDVYGFGFAGVWIALLLPFIVLCGVSYFVGRPKRALYWPALLGTYTLCSAGGFWLDRIIWPQIIG